MNIRSSAIGLAAVVVLMGAGAAQSLTGSNTVFSDDIVNETVNSADVLNESLGTSDIRNESLTGADILNNSLRGADIFNGSIRGGDILNDSITGADVDESTLTVTPADNSVTSSEVEDDSLTGNDVEDDSLTGNDVDESTLTPTCPAGMSQTGDLCYSGYHNAHYWKIALLDCKSPGLRLPSISEQTLVSQALHDVGFFWTDSVFVNGDLYAMTANVHGNVAAVVATDTRQYFCVTTVGARP